MNLKQVIYNVIRDDGHVSPINRIFSYGISVLIIANVVMVVLELLELVSGNAQTFFFYFEVVTVAVFTVEYILRLWTADLSFSRIRPAVARLRYIRSPMAIVDLLAVLPFYLPFIFPMNMIMIRLLRFLRLIRLAKLGRYSDSKTTEIVMSTIKESIILIDTNYKFIGANKSATDLFPSLKTASNLVLSISEVENWPDELRKINEKDEGKLINFDMNERHYETSISSIYKREKLLRYIIIISDITDSVKRIEAEKKCLEDAERASKAKSDFLSKMSHEIRTPMNGVIGMTELILHEELSESARDKAIIIKRSGDHLLSIVNEILDLSKVESGKQDLALGKYLFHSIINDVIHIIKVRMSNPDVRFAVYMQHDIPNTLFGDEDPRALPSVTTANTPLQQPYLPKLDEYAALLGGVQ